MYLALGRKEESEVHDRSTPASRGLFVSVSVVVFVVVFQTWNRERFQERRRRLEARRWQ